MFVYHLVCLVILHYTLLLFTLFNYSYDLFFISFGRHLDICMRALRSFHVRVLPSFHQPTVQTRQQIIHFLFPFQVMFLVSSEFLKCRLFKLLLCIYIYIYIYTHRMFETKILRAYGSELGLSQGMKPPNKGNAPGSLTQNILV